MNSKKIIYSQQLDLRILKFIHFPIKCVWLRFLNFFWHIIFFLYFLMMMMVMPPSGRDGISTRNMHMSIGSSLLSA